MKMKPLDRSSLRQHEALFEVTESILGYVPNSMLTMGRKPELLYSFSMLTSAVLQEKPKASQWAQLRLGLKLLVRIARLQRKPKAGISAELKWLVGYVTSRSAGCRYCQGHTVFAASRAGVDEAKIQAAFEFEQSDLFSDRERAALQMAAFGGSSSGSPPAEMADQFESRFSEDEVIEIVSIIALFGFLNRWNSLMETELEEPPMRFLNNKHMILDG